MAGELCGQMAAIIREITFVLFSDPHTVDTHSDKCLQIAYLPNIISPSVYVLTLQEANKISVFWTLKIREINKIPEKLNKY